uniref:Uncharacterized protein n=1 Tax=Oryza punctata TaxID=4537 RepID=A0A0E0LMW3_ORYPU
MADAPGPAGDGVAADSTGAAGRTTVQAIASACAVALGVVALLA